MVGGGSLPEESLPTKLVAIPGDGAYVTDLARRLRLSDPPLIARIERDVLLLDPRTVLPKQDSTVVQAVTAALSG
jgi:L-seryl-tRNA(Ser) seleniumtransferase